MKTKFLHKGYQSLVKRFNSNTTTACKIDMSKFKKMRLTITRLEIVDGSLQRWNAIPFAYL
jgi:hypothetical protein